MDMAMPMMVRVAPIQKVMEVLLGFVRSFIFGIVCAFCLCLFWDVSYLGVVLLLGIFCFGRVFV